MSETPPTRLLRVLEEDVSSARDRAQDFRRLAEAFEAAGDASRVEGALTEARAFDLYGNDNGGAFPGYFQPPVAVAGPPGRVHLTRSSTGPDQIAEALLADELSFQITSTYAALRQHLFGELAADYGLTPTLSRATSVAGEYIPKTTWHSSVTVSTGTSPETRSRRFTSSYRALRPSFETS